MDSRDDVVTGQSDECREVGKGGVSRREFLKLAGLAGATIGVGTGLGGVLAACGSGATTTTAAQATTTTAAAATVTTEPATSTTAGATAGRELKVGFVTPLTGALATFGIPDAYCVERWKEAVADGLVCGDGQKHPVSITVKDSQSDSNRAAQVAGDLVSNDKVDMVIAASTGDVVVPVADQCEALGVPCWTTDNPWESFFFGRKGDPKVGFKWTYHTFFGFGDWLAMFMDVWTQLPTNKVIGWLSANTTDGNTAASSFHPSFEKAGYKVIDGGRYQPGNEDFTSIISMYKKAGTQIIMPGPSLPPETSPISGNNRSSKAWFPSSRPSARQSCSRNPSRHSATSATGSARRPGGTRRSPSSHRLLGRPASNWPTITKSAAATSGRSHSFTTWSSSWPWTPSNGPKTSRARSPSSERSRPRNWTPSPDRSTRPVPMSTCIRSRTYARRRSRRGSGSKVPSGPTKSRS